MTKQIYFATIFSFLFTLTNCQSTSVSNDGGLSLKTEPLLTNVRQITFDGARAGEGYFSHDGQLLIFQSEREPNNPFYQMYVKDLETGKTIRVSNGKGKTTCGWIHPDKKRVLFSSTHTDPKMLAKMKEEIEARKQGTKRPYSWDFDDTYEIFEVDLKKFTFKNLTNSKGYDAEASWSPDGQWIVFASDRSAFSPALTEAEKQALQKNPSSLVELYIMKANGSEIRRLTNDIGYDGGPFFSADGQKIVWRKFNETGSAAEIYTMNVDGTDIKKLTSLNAISWAPYFHPTGDYIIFGTTLMGHSNFELYIIRADGKGEAKRVTEFERFDSLPVFHPNGHKLAWTSQRSWDAKAQIFMAEWNDKEARKLLDLPPKENPVVPAPTIATQHLKKHVEYLSGPDLGGRLTGSSGERLAAQYVAEQFRQIGLKPEGDKGSYFQDFDFYSGVELGEKNYIAKSREEIYKLNQDWRPLSFSSSGHFVIKDIVFVGYGIVAPGSSEFKPYDSYEGLDVKDKWVVSYRFLPEKLNEKYRIYLGTYADLPYKTRKAKEKGAKGIIFISGPSSAVKDQLISLGKNSTDLGIFSLSVTDDVMKAWLKQANQSIDIGSVQATIDEGKTAPKVSFQLGVSGNVDLIKKQEKGRNTIARLVTGAKPSDQAILIGAHIDHLGLGETSTSRATEKETGLYHPGADDNASGITALIEIARELKGRMGEGSLKGANKDIIFAAWSGEELGLLGSNHYVNQFKRDNLQPKIESYINLDMVGRLNGKLNVQGIGSSKYWPSAVETVSVQTNYAMSLQEDPYLPTDAMKLYTKHVPVISFFTGSHADYHKPTDTAEKLNYEGLDGVIKIVSSLSNNMIKDRRVPEYAQFSGASQAMARSDFRISLGTLPDYVGSGEVKGVKLTGVKPGSPAEKAGLQKDDVIIEMAGRKVSNIYEYSDLLRILRPGEAIVLKVVRAGREVSVQVTPDTRN